MKSIKIFFSILVAIFISMIFTNSVAANITSGPVLSGTYCSEPFGIRTILLLNQDGTIDYNQKVYGQGVPSCDYSPDYPLSGHGTWKYKENSNDTVTIFLPQFLRLTCKVKSISTLDCGPEGVYSKK